MLVTDKVSKYYKNNIVLDNVSLSFEEGKIYGLLGRNGVGKTTLLRIISNQIVNYQGEVKLFGSNLKENSKATENVLFVNEFMLPKALQDEKIKYIFKWVSNFLPNWDEEYKNQLLEEFNLDPKVKFKKLSKGNKNLISLIIGLASGTKYTLYDEPSVGLDANNRYKFYQQLMKNTEETNRTSIISTHIIDEVENIFEEVIILENAKVLMDEEIIKIQEKSLSLVGPRGEILRILGDRNIIEDESIGSLGVISIYDELSMEEKIRLKNAGVEITKLSLQKLFVYLTNKEEK